MGFPCFPEPQRPSRLIRVHMTFPRRGLRTPGLEIPQSAILKNLRGPSRRRSQSSRGHMCIWAILYRVRAGRASSPTTGAWHGFGKIGQIGRVYLREGARGTALKRNRNAGGGAQNLGGQGSSHAQGLSARQWVRWKGVSKTAVIPCLVVCKYGHDRRGHRYWRALAHPP